MRQIIIIILTLVTIQGVAQKLRPEINNLVLQIEKYNVLESEHVGIAGETTDQYKNFIKLRNLATNDELLELLNYQNSVVKGYSSWALVDNKYPKLYEILVEFLQTKETVTSQSGCIVSEDDLSTEFYGRVFYQSFHNKLNKEDSLFFSKQVQQLDSVILFSDQIQQLDYTIPPSRNSTYLLIKALENNNANPRTYERIKKLALIDKNNRALVALARYQNQNDISFFIEQGKNSFFAISVFPDNKFWDFLLSYSLEEKSFEYFLAVSSFKNDSASKLLNNIYTSCNADQIKDLDEAVIKNYCIHYQDLLLNIWENYKTIDYTITQSLIKDCPEKASLSFAKGLLNNNEYKLLELDQNYGTKDSILPLMIENVAYYNSGLLNDICIKNIENSRFMELSAILNFVEKRQIAETIPGILERLNKQNYPFEIYQLTETVLSFNNEEANLKLVKILKSNKADWDTGNWSEHFRKLFKEKNIKIE